MSVKYAQLLEEYRRMFRQAAPHLAPADRKALRVLLHKIEIHAVGGRPARTTTRLSRLKRARTSNADSPMALQAAASMDRIFSTRLAQAGALDDWEAHLGRVQGIVGPWPPYDIQAAAR